MSDIYLRITNYYNIGPEDISLFLDGSLLSPDSNTNAYDLFGEVILIE